MKHAFSLIELLVVAIILAIVAGVIAPRLASGTRDATASAERVRRVVSALGRREALTTTMLALDADTESVRVLIPDGTTRRSGRDEGWREDPLVPRADLGTLRVRAVTADATPLDDTKWRIVTDPGFSRPHIVVVLQDDRTGATWRVELPPHAIEASLKATGEGDRGMPSEDALVDLDATGGRNAPW